MDAPAAEADVNITVSKNIGKKYKEHRLATAI